MQINTSFHIHGYVAPDSQGVKMAVGLEDQESANFLVAPVKESDKSASSNTEANTSSSQSSDQQASDQSEQVVFGSKQTSSSGQNTSSDQASDTEKRQELLDQEVIRQLKARDLEVKNHEAAHAAVGGQYAGSPSFDYQLGPDGVRYAVGGEVKVDKSRVSGNPEATLEKMRVVRAAALAPSEPSSQDMKVAAEASRIAAQALQDMATQKSEERQATNESDGSDQEADSNTVQSSSSEDKKNIGILGQDGDKEKEDKKDEKVAAARLSAAERFKEVYGRTSQELNNIVALGLSRNHPGMGGLLNEIA